MVDVLEAHCDGSITGGAWGKKGEVSLPHAWSGWWVRVDGSAKPFKWMSIDLGEGEHMSANVAEYFAVRSVLAWLHTTPWSRRCIVKIISDSQTVIRQMTGHYNCYDPKLMLLRDECLKLAKLFPYVKYQWVPREQNKHADVLSKALQLWGRQPTWGEVEGRVAGKKIKKSGPPKRAAAPPDSGSSSPPSK